MHAKWRKASLTISWRKQSWKTWTIDCSLILNLNVYLKRLFHLVWSHFVRNKQFYNFRDSSLFDDIKYFISVKVTGKFAKSQGMTHLFSAKAFGEVQKWEKMEWNTNFLKCIFMYLHLYFSGTFNFWFKNTTQTVTHSRKNVFVWNFSEETINYSKFNLLWINNKLR